MLRNFRLRTFRAFVALLILLPCLAWAASARLTGLHVTGMFDRTHIVLNLSNVSGYKVFTLGNPNRLVVDLMGAHLGTSLHGGGGKTSVVNVRSGYPEPGVLRIVFDLRKVQRPTATISRSSGGKQKLVIDLFDPGYHPPAKPVQEKLTTVKKDKKVKAIPLPENNPTQTTATNNQPVDEESLQKMLQQESVQAVNSQAGTATQKPVTTSTLLNNDTNAIDAKDMPTPIATAPAISKRVINVVIDAGHGGKDPGTTGHFGVREKDVVLAISQNLFQLLQKDKRFRPVLTRSSDYFIPLRQRLAIAHKNNGDAFIAIHADTFKDPYATGASVYAVSAHGASSEAALWLAQKENYSELGGITLSDKSDILRSVLLDLSQTATISSSLKLGSNLLQELDKVGKLHRNNVEQAPFMVLKSPDIPSVLVETGFLSNPSEEERLRNPIYQQQIAQAIYSGLLDYFTTNPAAGKMIVNLKGKDKVN